MTADPPGFLDKVRLDGRVAVVTGGGSGLGRASAHALAELGAHVIVTDRDEGAAQTVAEEIKHTGGKADASTMNVSYEDQIDTMIDAIAATHGRLDILVNSAGIGGYPGALDLERDIWDKVIGVNLSGTFLCARAAARHMIDRKSGAIVNIASILGLVGSVMGTNIAYQASKGGVVAMTRALALEWAEHNIRVNAVAPGYAATQLTEWLLSQDDKRAQIESHTPMGRLVEPDEVAAAVAFLAGDAASMVTGHTLPVDGGWVAG
jgi:gluconate 5-dehydrogenase/2-deoxy-D-gluconate 3-dehydrogenase